MSNETVVIVGEEHTRNAQLLALRMCIQLELRGLKHSGGSVTQRVNRRFGWRGTKAQTYDRLNAHIVAKLGSDFDRPRQ